MLINYLHLTLFVLSSFVYKTTLYYEIDFLTGFSYDCVGVPRILRI